MVTTMAVSAAAATETTTVRPIRERLEEARREASCLDLKRVFELAREHLGHLWSEQYVTDVERHYRTFLACMIVAHEDGDEAIPPSRGVYVFWRIHTNFRGNYYQDMKHLLGEEYKECSIPYPPPFFFRNAEAEEATLEMWRMLVASDTPKDPPNRWWDFVTKFVMVPVA